jgi:DNA replication protein DnaC
VIHNYIEGLAERTKETIAVSESDYRDKDGFLVCGNCHTRKEIEVEFPWGKIRPYCLCVCEKAKQDAEKAAEEEKQRKERIERLRTNAFPDGSLAHCTFDMASDPNHKILLAMQRYVDNFKKFHAEGKGILLYGSVGTGKTFLSACTANALIDKGIPTMVTSVSYIANKLMGMYEGKNEYIEGLNTYPLLVLDDLGAERNTEYMNEVVYNVINARYKARLPLIVTTNLTTEQLKAPTDVTMARTYSRVLEMCFPIKVEGVDIRREKARNEYKTMSDILGL